jgi:DNA polymerase-3 subunit chi
MTEFCFHHVERRRVDQALADLLEREWQKGANVVVQAGSAEEVEALNERLWTYRDDSFLPHGAKRDGEPANQPIYLTDEADAPNGASLRALLSGVDATAFARGAHERVIILFDGRDEDAKARARLQWTAIKGLGEPLSYWREADDGGWAKGR